MRIDLSLLNAVRFETGESTALHVHTGHVDARDPLLVRPVIGPALHLKRQDPTKDYPITSTATPYGVGRSEMTGFLFGFDGGEDKNYATTAGADSPTLPPELKIEDELRLSAFLRPDSVPIPGGDMVLIAGVPGRFGLYQQHDTLVLRLHREGEPLPVDFACPTALAPEAWLLVEVQWKHDLNNGVPLWWINGIRPEFDEPWGLTEELRNAGDRFNLAHDPTVPGDELLFWSGALRELEVSNEVVWAEEPEDLETTDELMHARAMKLFGLATGSTPLPRFVRPSVAWIRVGGVRHLVSWHHPRATDLGTLVEEERTNLCEDSDEPFDTDPLSIPVTAGRYTIWFEQKSTPGTEAAYLWVNVPDGEHEDPPHYVVREGTPVVVSVMAECNIDIEKKGLGTVTFLQVERGVGPTSPIVTDGAPVTRAAETLAYRVTRSDIDFEQGRLDLEVTPQLDGPRGETGAVAQAGDILGMSLVRDEIVSADTATRPAALSGAGLWKARTTRSFHVEWQPGARLLWEDSLKLVAAADYSGAWPWETGDEAAWLYMGGAVEGGPRANAFFRNLVVDDRVPRFHADLHRFLYRQFGEGAFSEDESSVFRRWRRVEADGLALLARLGDRLKDQAFPDTTDLMLAVWEREIGLPAPWGLPEADRRALLAGLFRALGAADAEVEEQVARITGFAAVIERHREDVV